MKGAWCAGCGQESITAHGAFARTTKRQWARIRHTLVALVVHPGQLTAEFRDGQRARSISPWRLTLNIVTIFLLLSFVTDFNAANVPKHDPSGTLTGAMSAAAHRAGLSEAAFAERVNHRFNGIFTLLLTLNVATSALMARLTHWRCRLPWSVHLVFALHLTAWTFIANLVYFLAMRALGLPPTFAAQSTGVGVTLVGLILLWQFAYVLVAFRRVYADRWLGAGAKSVALLLVHVVVANALAVLGLYLAIGAASHVGG
jgi:hypothetical protein